MKRGLQSLNEKLKHHLCRDEIFNGEISRMFDTRMSSKPSSFLPFRRSRQLTLLDNLEVRSMYREEISIERGKFPTFIRVLNVHTDGSTGEHEVEYACPSFVVLFKDCNSVYKSLDALKRKAYSSNDTNGMMRPPKMPSEHSKDFQFASFPYFVPNIGTSVRAP